MSQPRYDDTEVKEMSNIQLAEHLEGWAKARELVAQRRVAKGKTALDAKLLWEAAYRLRESNNWRQ